MIFSFASVYEHENSIGGYKGPTMYKGEHESSIFGYKGPTMFWSRPIEDFGSGLGEFRDFPGPLAFIWASYELNWVLRYFGLYLNQFRTGLIWFYLDLNLFWADQGLLRLNFELIWV